MIMISPLMRREEHGIPARADDVVTAEQQPGSPSGKDETASIEKTIATKRPRRGAGFTLTCRKPWVRWVCKKVAAL